MCTFNVVAIDKLPIVEKENFSLCPYPKIHTMNLIKEMPTASLLMSFKLHKCVVEWFILLALLRKHIGKEADYLHLAELRTDTHIYPQRLRYNDQAWSIIQASEYS